MMYRCMQPQASSSSSSIASSFGRSLQRSAFARRQQPLLVRRAVSPSANLSFEDDKGTLSFDKALVLVGTAADADLQPSASNVAAQHAEVYTRNGRFWVKALGGDPDDLLSDTGTWVNGSQARPGVDYLLNPGDVLAFGEQSAAYALRMPEAKSASPGMMNLMMQGMLSNASDDVKNAVKE